MDDQGRTHEAAAEPEAVRARLETALASETAFSAFLDLNPSPTAAESQAYQLLSGAVSGVAGMAYSAGSSLASEAREEGLVSTKAMLEGCIDQTLIMARNLSVIMGAERNVSGKVRQSSYELSTDYPAKISSFCPLLFVIFSK